MLLHRWLLQNGIHIKKHYPYRFMGLWKSNLIACTWSSWAYTLSTWKREKSIIHAKISFCIKSKNTWLIWSWVSWRLEVSFSSWFKFSDLCCSSRCSSCFKPSNCSFLLLSSASCAATASDCSIPECVVYPPKIHYNILLYLESGKSEIYLTFSIVLYIV